MSFMIEYDDLLVKYNTLWDKVSGDIKKEFNSEPAIIKNFWKPKKNLIDMKLQIFTIKKFQRQTLIIFLAVISLDSALKKDENYIRKYF